MQQETRIRTPGWGTPHSHSKRSITITFVFSLCTVAAWIYGAEIRAAENPNDSPRRNVLVGPIDQDSIRQIGFLIGDKIEGPFRMEIAWIRAVPADMQKTRGEALTVTGTAWQHAA